MEFTGLHQQTELISIGLVTDWDERYYAEVSPIPRAVKEVDQEWLKTNVHPHLKLQKSTGELKEKRVTTFAGDVRGLRRSLRKWLSQFEDVTMVSDCLAYDWVLFNTLFEDALPPNINYIPLDICTYFHLAGVDPDVKREEFAESKNSTLKHNALWDALVIQKCFKKLSRMMPPIPQA